MELTTITPGTRISIGRAHLKGTVIRVGKTGAEIKLDTCPRHFFVLLSSLKPLPDQATNTVPLFHTEQKG